MCTELSSKLKSRKFICWVVMTGLSTALLWFGKIPPGTWYAVVSMGAAYMVSQGIVDREAAKK